MTLNTYILVMCAVKPIQTGDVMLNLYRIVMCDVKSTQASVVKSIQAGDV